MRPKPLTAVSTALLAAIAVATLGFTQCARHRSASSIDVPGLLHPVKVVTDSLGVPHIYAEDDTDLARVQGYIHARDRFWQMDTTRREVSGDLAELLGVSALQSDVQMRTLGLRRAALRSEAILTTRERQVLQAYADGVNAWLSTHPLPPEYADLELTKARPWDVVDSLVIGKAIAASLSLDIDVGPTQTLQAFVQAGQQKGFDGSSLFFQDLHRAAPMVPVSTVPDATGSEPFAAWKPAHLDERRLASAAAEARRYQARAERVPFLAAVLNRHDRTIGSNEWGVSAANSANGEPMIANDPHLSLGEPSTFYEDHLIVSSDPVSGPMDVSGVSFPGVPFVVLGQNERITWGATTNPMDVSDVFQDTMIKSSSPACAPVGLCIQSAGALHPVDLDIVGYTSPDYQVNHPTSGVQDDVTGAGALLDITQRVILTVPFRSNGPIIDVTDPGVLLGGSSQSPVLTLQYTGFHATREVETFRIWNRAQNLTEFENGLQSFDFGSQNWAYADADGNLAYFTSAELPLRADLEAGQVVGVPPFFIRDGSGPDNWIPDPAHSQGQAIPYAVLPAAEMPHTVNPSNGFFANANNDPAGTTLDNDPLNQHRVSNPTAIYYLNGGYDEGLRAGRITRLIQAKLDAGDRISMADMKHFQANTQELDAELMVPFLVQAFDDASAAGAPPELVAAASDPRVVEAVGRLRSWDFSTPTGIPEGYDASDFAGFRRPHVSHSEAMASVAATIYNVWRAKLIGDVVDQTTSSLGLPGLGSGDALKALYHLLAETPFTGRSAAGDVDFFPQPATVADPAQRRDVVLLQAMGEALDALASDDFKDAFANSTHQDDYRWGRLHRIVFRHQLGGPYSIPPAAGFQDLAPNLPGLSRDGGYEVVNASSYSTRAAHSNDFMFGGGPVRRYVGAAGLGLVPDSRVVGFNVIPGGSSGVLGSPFYATQLPLWLTVDYHPVPMRHAALLLPKSTVEDFEPPPTP